MTMPLLSDALDRLVRYRQAIPGHARIDAESQLTTADLDAIIAHLHLSQDRVLPMTSGTTEPPGIDDWPDDAELDRIMAEPSPTAP